MRTYLDHNATSRLKPAARAAMLDALDEGGNASSVHGEGRAARAALDRAREAIAARLGVIAPMVIFTSGGSEANNLALRGVKAERLILSAIEHPSVIEAARARGLAVEIVPVTGDGIIDLTALEKKLAAGPGPALVSLMHANNETGVLQPIAEAAALVREHAGLLHVDAAQTAGRITVNMPVLGADLLTLSAHKMGGPQGAGALVIRDGLPLEPLIAGGGQELRRRAGTENIAAAQGFAAAMADLWPATAELRDRLEAEIRRIAPDAVIFGAAAPRLPNTSCFALPGIAADIALISLDLDGVAVSSGSACSSGKVGRSHVLAAMGVDPELAQGAIRMSLGWDSTVEDVNRFAAALTRLAERLKSKQKAA